MSKSYVESNYHGDQINTYPYCIDLPTESLKLCYAVEYLSKIPGHLFWFSMKDQTITIHFNTTYRMAVIYHHAIQEYIQQRMDCK